MGFDDKRVNDVKQVLAKSETGRLLLDFAKANNTDIRFTNKNHEHKAHALYWPGRNKVELGMIDDNEKLASSLGHELTHAWQDFTGLLQFKPDHAAGCFFHARMIEAVAYGIQEIIKQELKLARLPDVLNTAISPHIKASAFRKGFNKMSGRKRDNNDRYSERRYKISQREVVSPTLNQEMADFETHISEIIESYGAMPRGQNILRDTGGLNSRQSKNIFAGIIKK